MAFFETVDALGIAEEHIKQVSKLEEDAAKAVLRKYKEARQELRDRLDRLKGDTFSAQQLRGTLVQVEKAIDAMSLALGEETGQWAMSLGRQSVDDLVEEMQFFENEFTGAVIPINLNAVEIATDTSNFLINRYEASIEAYSQDMRAMITSGLTQSVIQQEPLDKVVRRLSQFFLDEEWRLLRIVRTELHNVYGLGKLKGMRVLKKKQVKDIKKALLHPLDARTAKDSKYLANMAPVLPIDEPFRYKWAGKWREFMSPPDRPNDRGILIPYRDAWGPVEEKGSLFRTVNG